MLIKDLATNRNYRTALLILVISTAWLVSGMFTSHESEAQEDKVVNMQNVLVKAEHLQAVDFVPSVAVKGRTEPNRRVVLKAQIGGLLEFRADNEGQAVEAGTLLCRLAEEDRALKVQEARSALTQATIEYDGAQALKTAGYQSKQAIAAAKARMDSASALLKRRELDMEYLELRAPFKGVVETFHVEQGDLLNVSTPCAALLELNPLVVVGQVSERVVSQLQIGMPVDVALAGFSPVQGTLRYVASEADALTRTFRIEAVVDNPDNRIRAGLTTNVSINLPSIKAHNVPSSLLSLDDAGRMGLKYLDDDNVVHFALVQTLADSEQGVWVSGLPDETALVTIGQEYVSAGQRVDVSFEQANNETGR